MYFSTVRHERDTYREYFPLINHLEHTQNFTNREIYTQNIHTQKILHTIISHTKKFYTQNILHTKKFHTQKQFKYTKHFTHKTFYTQNILHTKKF